MALKRARGAHDQPVIMLVTLAAVGWMCALLVGRMDRMHRDVCRSIRGIEGRLLTQVDELCTAAHTIGMAAEAARAASAARPSELGAEADEAERIADQEEHGKRAPQRGQRARRTAS